MSEKAKAMAEKIAALPDELQDKFMDKVEGATMALDFLEESSGKTTKKEGG